MLMMTQGNSTPEAGPRVPVVTVALIAENRLIRDGITAVLQRFTDIRVVPVHPHESESLQERARPQVILLDLGLENGNSLSVAKRTIETHPWARVIVMQLFPAEDEIVEFIRAGVAGFIMKDATVEAVAGSIRTVAAGNPALPAEMTGRLFSELGRGAVSRGTVEQGQDAVRLTQRESEVIHLIATGLSNKGIAKRLVISTHTVKTHLRNIMEKLAVHTRLQIAAYAHGMRPAPMIEEATEGRDERAPQLETIPDRVRTLVRRSSTTTERDHRIHRNLRDPRKAGSRRAEHALRLGGNQA